MKTIDEVIRSFELSCGKKDCGQCPYDDECLDHHVCECYERMADALHYLKEYRMQLDDIVAKRQALEAEKDRYAEAVRNCEQAENKYRKMEDELNNIRRDHIEQMKNDPLTWDDCDLQAVIDLLEREQKDDQIQRT